MAPWVAPAEASCTFVQNDAWWVLHKPLSGASLNAKPLGLWHPVEGDVKWPEKLDSATDQFRGCTATGTGRYWAVQVLRMQGWGALQAPEDRLDSCVRSVEGEAFESAWGSEAKCEGFAHLVFGLCAPASCSKASVQGFFWRSLWVTPELRGVLALLPEAHARALLRNLSLERVAARSLVQAHNMRQWADLRLDWVVLGFPGSGTSAVMANLHAHPAVEVLASEWDFLEDAFFCLTAMHRFHLPTKLRVDRFNSWQTKRAAPELQKPRLRGIKYPNYIYSDVALARLTQIPGVKGVVLMNDPHWLIERAYLVNWQRCQQSNSSYPPLSDCLGENGSRCQQHCDANDAAAAELRRGPELSPNYFGLMLQRVARAIEVFTPRRFFLAPSVCFQQRRSCHDRLAKFLGAGPFPSNFSFRKWNVHNYGNKRQIKNALLSSGNEVRASHLAALELLREQQAPEREILRFLVQKLPHADEKEWPADLLQK